MPIDDAERKLEAPWESLNFSREAGAPRYSQIRGSNSASSHVEEATLMATYKSRIMPKRTNSADRHSAHSGTTQQGAQQPAATENLRETNVEPRKRTQRPVQKTSSILFAGLHERVILPKLPGDVKD